jgi:hypothetical protein
MSAGCSWRSGRRAGLHTSGATAPCEPVHRISPRPFLQFPASVARRFCHEITALQRLTGTRASTPSPHHPSTRAAPCSALPPCLPPHSPSRCPRLGVSTPRLPELHVLPSPTSCSPMCAVLPSTAPSIASASPPSVIASTPRSLCSARRSVLKCRCFPLANVDGPLHHMSVCLNLALYPAIGYSQIPSTGAGRELSGVASPSWPS